MSFDAGAITGHLTLDLSEYAHGMVEATQIAELFPSVVRSFLAEPLLGLMDLAKEAGEAIKEAFLGAAEGAHALSVESLKAGVGAEFLEHVAAAAKTCDVSLEEVAHSMAFLGRNAADAAAGNQSMAATFDRLGVAFTDAGGKVRPIEELFNEVADAIQKLPTAAQQAQGAMDLLSRGGIDMLPVLKKGATGVQELADEMLQFRGSSSASLIDTAEQWHHLEAFATEAWEGIKAAIAQPILQYVGQHFEELKQTVADFAKSVKQFVGDWVIPALEMLGSTVKWVMEHFDGLSTAIEVFISYKAITAVIEAIAASYATLAKELTTATVAQIGMNNAMKGAGTGAAVGAVTTGSKGGVIGGAIGGVGGALLGAFFGPVGSYIGQLALGYVGSEIGDYIDKHSGSGTTVNVNGNTTDTNAIMDQTRREIDAARRRGKSELEAQVHSARVNMGMDLPFSE